jgi:hypothetical protein
MNNGACLPNLNCTSRQFFYQGLCVGVPLACASFTANGTCIGCVAGTHLQDGICTQSIQTVYINYCTFPCYTCFQARPNFCYSCSIGYSLVNGRYGSCVSTATLIP